MKKIIAIFGCGSSEHDVSVITAIEALNACPYGEYKVYPVYVKGGEWYSSDSMLDINVFVDFDEKKHKKVALIGKNLYFNKRGKWKLLDAIDGALLLTHGGQGESGELQGFLELSGVPYTSCNVRSSVLAMDKYLLKLALKDLKVSVVKGVAVCDAGEESIAEIENKVGYPAFIKPNSQGSSIGVGLARDRAELLERLGVAFEYDSIVLAERYVQNATEYNCAVMKAGDVTLVSEIEKPLTSGDFLSFGDKYLDFSKTACLCNREFPAKISEKLREEIRSTAEKVYMKLGLFGIVRFDFIYDGRLYLNEVNAIPGSLAHYLFPNVNYTDLIKIMIEEGLERGVKEYGKYDSGVLNELKAIRK